MRFCSGRICTWGAREMLSVGEASLFLSGIL
jgi:hypothetical protein